MLDLKFLRENPEVVKENIKRKFQDAKLPIPLLKLFQLNLGTFQLTKLKLKFGKVKLLMFKKS